MTRSCFTCRFARMLPNGTFCGRYPPTLEVIRDERTIQLSSWMPPIPLEPCGEYARSWRLTWTSSSAPSSSQD